ncbi:MAG: sodium ion-translocating decarboxylase subunit beta [Erysipelotrichaceae bacterium]|nr:sodium ion-translocating decarboxylase subunit beta [Erysipelotrichaceae bacterium]
MNIWSLIGEFFETSGVAGFFQNGGWMNLVMILVGVFFLVLALVFKFEPYLLIPISFGIILTNIPGAHIFTKTAITDAEGTVIDYQYSGLLGYLYYGVKYEIYPCLIFLGIGATTDFGPLISNKKTMLLGAAAQIGIFAAFFLAIALGFNGYEAASIGIIGGADGPTAILVSSKMLNASGGASLNLLAPIALAAYSYMALVPVIFPPIIKLFTTKKERTIKMQQLREVSKREKILFPIIVTLIVALIVPGATPLIGCLMLGNLIKESGLVPNLVHTVANALLYICTIALGLSVGATAQGAAFLTVETLKIFALGIGAFILAGISGLLGGKLMCVLTKGKVNPMIGIAGVSAVPMAARVVQREGQKEDPSNFLLMHAMGPNVAGVIGSAIAAGILMAIFL